MIFLISLIIIPLFQAQPFDSWLTSSGIQFGSVALTSEYHDLEATRDIYRKDLIFSIPLNATLHPLEDYAFKEFFNISSKDTLIGRLIIERLLSNVSSLFPWLETLPKPKDMTDLFHFNDRDLGEFLSRSFEDFPYLKSRKEKFLKIRKNIPISLLNEQSLNFETYNWAASVVDAHACVYELDTHDPSRLGVVRLHNPATLSSGNLILIPLMEKIHITGFENAKPGVFNEDYEENPQLFRYIQQKGDRLEVRAQKLIEKGSKVSLSDSKSNREYIQYHGILVQEEQAKDFLLKLKPEFDMERIRLCWDLSVSVRKSLVFSFNLNAKTLNVNLAVYAKIALLPERENYEEDKREIIRKLEEDGASKQKLEVFMVYWKVVMGKWREFQKEGKTSLLDDLKEWNKGVSESKRKLGLDFAINAKEVFLRNVVMVQRKIMKEMRREFRVMNSRF